jgi:hypothetical protein
MMRAPRTCGCKSVRNPGETEGRREWKVGGKGGIRQPKKKAARAPHRPDRGQIQPIKSIYQGQHKQMYALRSDCMIVNLGNIERGRLSSASLGLDKVSEGCNSVLGVVMKAQWAQENLKACQLRPCSKLWLGLDTKKAVMAK